MPGLNYSDVAPLGLFGYLDDAVETAPRWAVADGSLTLGASTVFLSYFSAYTTQVIGQLGTLNGSLGASTAVTARLGLYTVSPTDSLALVARTASNSGFAASAYQEYTYSLATAGGFPSSYRIEKGFRYAAGLHSIFTGPMPNIRASAGGLPNATNARSPRISGALLSQADLPTSIAASAVADYGFAAPYVVAYR